jgi:phage baseplate assembly protein W
VTQKLIAYEIVQAIEEWEPRIKVTMDGIGFAVDGGKLEVEINYEVVSYSLMKTMKVYLGKLNEGTVGV